MADFPAPLGSTARQSRPAASATAASTCAGRKTAKPRTSRAISRTRAPVSSLPSISPAAASRREAASPPGTPYRSKSAPHRGFKIKTIIPNDASASPTASSQPRRPGRPRDGEAPGGEWHRAKGGMVHEFGELVALGGPVAAGGRL